MYGLKEDAILFLSSLARIKEKIYIGRWKTKGYLREFNSTEGIIKLRIVANDVNNYSKLIIKQFSSKMFIILLDGNYSDNYLAYSADLVYNQNFFHEEIDNKSIFKSLDVKAFESTFFFFKNSKISCKIVYLKLVCNFAFVIESIVNKNISITENKLSGKLSSEMCQFDFEFEAEVETLEYNKHQLTKINNFSLILTIIGAVQLIQSIMLIQKLNTDPDYTRKVNYLIDKYSYLY